MTVPSSSPVQDVSLSRRKLGFESPWDYQKGFLVRKKSFFVLVEQFEKGSKSFFLPYAFGLLWCTQGDSKLVVDNENAG